MYIWFNLDLIQSLWRRVVFVHVVSQRSAEINLPDDVIVVTQVELLGVFPRVVDHAHPGHEVHHLFPGGVVQVVATLVTSVAVDPLQPQLAARRRLIHHVGSETQR